MNKFLYRHFHSWHHRLYVPYAFGALYNHPFEGFLLDSLGAVIAESVSGMSTRQAALLFSIATFKTVDDHCGYRFSFDPLQFMSKNNADYHDIHHQARPFPSFRRSRLICSSKLVSNPTLRNHSLCIGTFYSAHK